MYPGGVAAKPESKPVSIMFSWFGYNNLEANGVLNGTGESINAGGKVGFMEVQESTQILPMFLLNLTCVSVGVLFYYDPYTY